MISAARRAVTATIMIAKPEHSALSCAMLLANLAFASQKLSAGGVPRKNLYY
jgi:hypothetical protein